MPHTKEQAASMSLDELYTRAARMNNEWTDYAVSSEIKYRAFWAYEPRFLACGTRLRNCLHNAEIKSLEPLLLMTKKQMMLCFGNFGAKCYRELLSVFPELNEHRVVEGLDTLVVKYSENCVDGEIGLTYRQEREFEVVNYDRRKRYQYERSDCRVVFTPPHYAGNLAQARLFALAVVNCTDYEVKPIEIGA